jgi:hypothetical protein
MSSSAIPPSRSQSFDGVVVKASTSVGATDVTPGMPVKGTILYAKPGGVMKSVGILTLQLTSVGSTPVESSRYHVSADLERPTGTKDVVRARDTILRFSVRALSPGSRRRP